MPDTPTSVCSSSDANNWHRLEAPRHDDRAQRLDEIEVAEHHCCIGADIVRRGIATVLEKATVLRFGGEVVATERVENGFRLAPPDLARSRVGMKLREIDQCRRSDRGSGAIARRVRDRG